MVASKKVSDQDVLLAYEKHRSCKKAAAELGINSASLHERLVRLGANEKVNRFSQAEEGRLRRDYAAYSDAGQLELLASEMSRTRQFICRKARLLGLTNRNRRKTHLSKWKTMPEPVARGLFEKFKGSSLGLSAFCRRFGYGETGFWRTMTGLFPDEWEQVIELKVPKTSKYRIGRQFEYRIRDELKKIGFFLMRSPGSKSPTDLVAIATGVVLFVQCKKGGYCSPAEWNELFDLATSVGARPILAKPGVMRGTYDYLLLTGRKDGSEKREPAVPFDPLARAAIAGPCAHCDGPLSVTHFLVRGQHVCGDCAARAAGCDGIDREVA